jgi:hypothetical protein
LISAIGLAIDSLMAKSGRAAWRHQVFHFSELSIIMFGGRGRTFGRAAFLKGEEREQAKRNAGQAFENTEWRETTNFAAQ